MIEIKEDLYAVGVYNTKDYIHIVNRKDKNDLVKITHPGSSDSCLQMIPIYHFNSDTLPYAFVRDKDTVTMVDLKTYKSYLLLEKKCENYLY